MRGGFFFAAEGGVLHTGEFGQRDAIRAFGRLLEVAEVVRQLGDGDLNLADGDPLFTWPALPETEWTFPHTSHIDGYGTHWEPFMLGATTYLYDVESRGGGLATGPEAT